MRIINKNENTFVFLIPNKSFNINFNQKKDLEKYFQDFFLKLKNTYDFKIKGFYLINIYIDENYGIALEITNEDEDYLEYFRQNIDMNISKPKKNKFLYKINDIFLIDKKILAKFDIYLYNNNYYLCLKNKIKEKELINLLEFVDIIYDSENIIKRGKLLRKEV